MKKSVFILLYVLLSITIQAQNIFPSSGDVGIGTTLPNYPLDVVGNIQASGQFISNSTEPLYFTGSGTGTYTVSTVYNNTSFFRIDLARVSNTYYTNPIDFMISGRGGDIFFVRKGNTGDVLFNDNNENNLLKISGNGNVGIGTTTPQSKLAVNGTVTAKQLKITQTGWADKVFDSAYHLPSLTSTIAYIKIHHHLPDIPSEGEVQKNGIDIGEMQKRQMQKIEELTLYLINLNAKAKLIANQIEIIPTLTKSIQELSAQVDSLKAEVAALQASTHQ